MVQILDHLSVELLTLDAFPIIGDIPETGSTLKENAFIKAETVHQITGLPALADDTGLEVDALNGAPGVYSARYAGENATFDTLHVFESLLLQEVQGFHGSNAALTV